MESIILAAVILLIVGLAAMYVRREKKNGAVCIGCPHAKSCGKHKNCGCDSKNA